MWVQSHDEDMKALHETTPTLLRRSKRTLLILRRGRRLANGSITYDPIDMRHQRHPDDRLLRHLLAFAVLRAG